jgi:hypothetical protein
LEIGVLGEDRTTWLAASDPLRDPEWESLI